MYPYYVEVPEFLKPDITAIRLQHPPEDHVMYIPGKDNIWINWNFNTRSIDENIIAKESKAIFDKKNGGKSDILLIWCDLGEVYNRIDEIKEELVSRFKETTFEFVFSNCLTRQRRHEKPRISISYYSYEECDNDRQYKHIKRSKQR